MEPKEIKTQLQEACSNYLRTRKATAILALQQAVEASNDDTKSSAGDKYETTREMMQQEIDRNKKLLLEVGMQEQILKQVFTQTTFLTVQNGSLLITNLGNFYIAIAVGKVQLNGQDYYVISQASPLGQKMMHLAAGQTAEFNGNIYKILELH